jgi:beta-xylosidase
MKKCYLSLFALAVAASVGAATYKNPVLVMDFSDPDVCVGHDGKFYMTASSFGGLPGLPILVSDDLVNWQYAAYALKEHPFATHSPEHGNAVWAPSIRRRSFWKTEDSGTQVWTHEYVIYWGDPDRGAYRISAPDPRGPWSEPRLVLEGKGIIDTCPLYDDDGRVYLVNGWAQSRAGMNSVLTVRELDKDETHAISDPVMVYNGVPDGNFTAEGPKFYKRNGEYWLFFPAGGVGGGWQVAARAKTPYGPFEAKTVMAQGKTKINGPHQGAWVHCEVVHPNGEKSGSGEDWFVHFSDRDAYGRIVYLEPMKWLENGWPVIGVDEDGDGCGEPVEEYEMPKVAPCWKCRSIPCTNDVHKAELKRFAPQASDEFNDGKIGLQWQWLGKSDDFAGWATPYGFYRQYTTSYGRIVLSGSLSGSTREWEFKGSLWDAPNLMVQKFPAFAFTATMKARVGAKEATEESGLIIQGRSYARIGLRCTGKREFEVVYVECRDADKGKDEDKAVVLATVPATVIGAGLRTANVKDVWLKVDVTPGEIPEKGLGPKATCEFSWSLDGEKWTKCDKTFQAREGKWIGATVGIYAVSNEGCRDRGWIDVDWFRVVRR